MAEYPRAKWTGTKDISGGLYTNRAAFNLSLDQSPNAQNFDPSEPVGCKKRNGHIKFTSPANPAPTGTLITGLFAGTLSNGTTKVIATEGTAVYDITAGNWATTITGATITAETPVRMRLFNDLFIICNQGGGPYKWSGSGAAAALGGSPPANARILCVHKSRVWMANGTDSTIYFSSLSNPEDWTAANNAGNIVLNKNDGYIINGIESTGDVLIISKMASSGKEGALYGVYGSTPFDFSIKRIATFGAISQEAMVPFDSFLTLASYKGIYAVQGKTTAILSQPIRATYRDIPTKTGIVGGRYKDQLWWAYPTSGSVNNAALVLDMVRGVWAPYTGKDRRLFTTHPDGRLLSARAGTSQLIYEEDNGTNDDSAAISYFWETPDLDFERFDADKIWKLLFLFAEDTGSYNITVEHYLDGELQSDSVTVSVAQTGSIDRIVKRIVGKAGERAFRHIRFKFSNNTADQAIRIYGYTAAAEVLEPTR